MRTATSARRFRIAPKAYATIDLESYELLNHMLSDGDDCRLTIGILTSEDHELDHLRYDMPVNVNLRLSDRSQIIGTGLHLVSQKVITNRVGTVVLRGTPDCFKHLAPSNHEPSFI